MPRGTYSRNLDACTLQLSNWSPFVADHLLDEDVHRNRSYFPLADDTSLDAETSRSSPRESSALPPARCPWKQISSRNAGNEGCRWSLKDLSMSLDLEYKSESKKLRRASDHGMEDHCYESRLSYTHTAEDVPMTLDNRAMERRTSADSGATVAGIYGVTGFVAEPSILSNRCSGVEGMDCSEFSMFTTNVSLSGWSKRQQQFSKALARGLWRWTENSQARKKRRKGGSSRSRSGSGRSSDSRRARMYASDPPTVAASVPYATCSDIPIPGTDSSGELFFCGECGGIGWDSEVSMIGESNIYKRDGLDVFHAWIKSETQSIESGYGSEPGYRGDGELGYEDDGNQDEQDEEERQQFRLSPWRESNSCKISVSAARGRFDKISGEKVFMGELTSSSESKVQHRLRRRRQDLKSVAGQRNRDSNLY